MGWERADVARKQILYAADLYQQRLAESAESEL